jgi:putative hydrolase of the HAD superfamily
MASENGRYAGLLIDWGGVLTTDLFASFSAFCEVEGLEPDAVRRVFREDAACRDLLIAFETGALGEEQFETEFAPYLGVDSHGLIHRLFAGSAPDDDMIEAVRRARDGGVRTGLVSNSWGTRRYPRELLGELFDGVVISGEVGLHKPDPEIFHMGAERIGVPVEECVFVDDLRENCDGAAAVGMTPILHRGADTTLPELERLLGLELR